MTEIGSVRTETFGSRDNKRQLGTQDSKPFAGKVQPQKSTTEADSGKANIQYRNVAMVMTAGNDKLLEMIDIDD